jgi:hypothetical protein
MHKYSSYKATSLVVPFRACHSSAGWNLQYIKGFTADSCFRRNDRPLELQSQGQTVGIAQVAKGDKGIIDGGRPE